MGKLETQNILTVDDFHTSTGMHTTTLSSISLEDAHFMLF